jgi:hypothetical protein
LDTNMHLVGPKPLMRGEYQGHVAA